MVDEGVSPIAQKPKLKQTSENLEDAAQTSNPLKVSAWFSCSVSVKINCISSKLMYTTAKQISSG